MTNKYYVYEWFIKDTREIFYVGKGCGNRVTSMKNRNEYFKNIRKKHDCDYRIVKNGLCEEDAYNFELQRGMELKQIGQARACYVLGKADKFVAKETKSKISKTLKDKPFAKRKPLTEEHKRKLSEAHKGKKQSEETKKKRAAALTGRKRSVETKAKLSEQKIGEKNPMFGKKQSQETINKRAKKLIGHIVTEETRKKIGASNGKPVKQISCETSEVIATYISASEAGRKTGTQSSKISAVCNGKRKTAGGYKWSYINQADTEVNE